MSYIQDLNVVNEQTTKLGKIILIFAICLIIIIIIIIIGGCLTNWKFIPEKKEKYVSAWERKDRYDEKYIPFTTKLKKYIKSPKMNSDKWVKYVDKVLFKDYAKSKGVYTAKILLGPFDDANEIKLKDIPENCVLKTNNGSGRNIGIKNGKIIFDGLDGPNKHFKGRLVKDVWNDIKKQLNEWRKPYKSGYEPWYQYIKPKIFAEELLDPIPNDYKFFVFNRKVKVIQLDNDRFSSHSRTYYDINWKDTGCKDSKHNKCKKNLPKPKTLDKMVKAAESLAEGLEFARVDLYNYNGKILGGEITFGPGAGHEHIEPKSCDIMFSNYWNFIKRTSKDGLQRKNLENFLIEKEKHYGGFVQNVKRNNTSTLDPRTRKEIATGG